MKDQFSKLVVRLLPKRVRYWVYLRVGLDLIHPDEVVPEVTFLTVLKRAMEEIS